MRKPYIGITGFMSRDEALAVSESVPATSTRLVMEGVLASLKTLRGFQNKWPNRYPAMDKIAGIFTKHPLAFNLIHYNTDERDTLTEQLFEMTEIGGANLHGFQLNVAWPTIYSLKAYRKAYPDKQIVLQIGRHALEDVENSPELLAVTVSAYAGLIDYVLFDPSGGIGKAFKPRLARECLLAIKSKNPEIGLGVAGGLSPTTLDLVEPLISEFPDLSIDAEGRLRDKNDSLNLALAKEYIAKALNIFNS